ncbi:MAG TPA: NYN domain-containing protein [Gemmatimonadales bacterium]|nr:NYN domain-containing protein [Gemmatimonadales bacterium]
MTFPSPRPASKQPPAHAPNAALLIDFDNVTMGIRSDLQVELRKLLDSDIIRGKVAVQRAYADWRRYPQYIVPLSEASIDLIFAPAFGSNKKNATDIRLAIDAVELVFTRPEIGTVILLSGDSDFSSLVIKLKEYGKYIIGVGIRESASDLLIQNCDEYYSYNELAGLARAGEDEGPKRDPWDLVVDAVLEMKKRNDVMRSDRLKQVMQELDASFDEKNVGMSRFSKFVDEAKRRGLLTATKLENGQFEIDLGASAPGGERALPPIPGGADERRGQERAEHERAGGGRSRRGRRGGRGPAAEPARESAAPAAAGAAAPLSLAEAFDLLKRALHEVGAFPPTSVGEDLVRERMEEMHGNAQDPLFHRPRFGRLLRQAQDAGLVDLSKDERGFEVVLKGEAAAPVERAEPAAGEQAAERGGRRGRRGRGGRSRGEGGREERASAPEPEVEAELPPAPRAAPEASAPPAHGPSGRGLLYRRGSRRAAPPAGGVPLVGVVEIDSDEPEKGGKAKAAPQRRARGGVGRRPARGRSKKKSEEPPAES